MTDESRLQEALDLLDHGEHWGKGTTRQVDWDDGRIRWCPIGAIEAAWGLWDLGLSESTYRGMCADAERLKNAIPRDRRFHPTIQGFNDFRETTWEDVALAFKKAIAEETA